MNIWANGEPEIIQYGTSVLGESFPTKIKCEERLRILSKDQNLTEDFGINGILRNKLVYRSFADRHIDRRLC